MGKASVRLVERMEKVRMLCVRLGRMYEERCVNDK